MCTVSIIPLLDTDSSSTGFRIVCNRDERRTRPPAAAPRWRAIANAVDCGPTKALWPMDMEAGGTWIAASDRGLVLCVLNLNPHPPVSVAGIPSLRSRGLIIPDLIGETGAEAAVDRLERLGLRQYAPFRILAIDDAGHGPQIAEARWDRVQLSISWHTGPACFVSSGLGDHVASPRLGLFQELVVRPGAIPDLQDRFHRHSWPERTQASVLMSRPDARTVSITTLEVLRHTLPTMSYEGLPAGGEALAGLAGGLTPASVVRHADGSV